MGVRALTQKAREEDTNNVQFGEESYVQCYRSGLEGADSTSNHVHQTKAFLEMGDAKLDGEWIL